MADAGERLRRAVRAHGGDLWSLIDDAVAFAAARENADELRARRDGIVARLYMPPEEPALTCRKCGAHADEGGVQEVQSDGEGEGEGEDVVGGDDDVKEIDDGGGDDDGLVNKILAIRDFIEDPDEPEDSLVSLLQNLADMDITYQALQETDIGRCVNALRKHPSGEVRRLVKQLVRGWKELVDEWVLTNNPDGGSDTSPMMKLDMAADGESPQKNRSMNHQGSQRAADSYYFPSPQNGTLRSSERDGSVPVERRAKPEAPRWEAAAPSRPSPQANTSSSAALRAKSKELTDILDSDRLDFARKRLHENYQEAENAKKQRTIQVMDIHEIPKPKNAFIRRGGPPPKHRR